MFSVRNKTALLELVISAKLRIAIFLQHNFYQLSSNYDLDLLTKLTSHISFRNIFRHEMVDSIFSKITFSPQSRSNFRNVWKVDRRELHRKPLKRPSGRLQRKRRLLRKESTVIIAAIQNPS